MGYLIADLALKPLIQCKNKEIKSIRDNDTEYKENLLTCTTKKIFDIEHFFEAMIVPGTYLVSQYLFPSAAIYTALSIQMAYSVVRGGNIGESLGNSISSGLYQYVSNIVFPAQDKTLVQSCLEGSLAPVSGELITGIIELSSITPFIYEDCTEFFC